MNLEIENEQLKIQIIELQGQLLSLLHKEAKARLETAQQKLKTSVAEAEAERLRAMVPADQAPQEYISADHVNY